MYQPVGQCVGDAWYCVDEAAGTVHMFCLTWPRTGAGPFDTVIGHAVSTDLVNWTTLAPALEPGPAGAWDDLKLCGGSVSRWKGRYWLAYSATSGRDSSVAEPWRVQRVGLAVSDDLCTWKKIPANPVTEPTAPLYERLSTGERPMQHWRDPFLYDAGETVVQLVCARRTDGDPATRGTVAVADSRDMQHWRLREPLPHDRVAQEMELPQIYSIDGRWYLVFCTLGRFMAPAFRNRFEGTVPERSNFAMIGPGPLGPFRLHGTGQIVAHDPAAYFYAAQLVCFRNRWSLLATVANAGTNCISDPIPVRADNTGIHAGD